MEFEGMASVMMESATAKAPTQVRSLASYAVSRAALVVLLAGMFLALSVPGSLRVIIAIAALASSGALLVVAAELQKRAGWYAEPGVRPSPVGPAVAAIVDSGLVVALATVLSADGWPQAAYPGAAVAKCAAIFLFGWTAMAIFNHRRDGRADSLLTIGCAVTRIAGGVVAWIIADQVVPAEWRLAQAVECFAAVAVLVATTVAVALLWRRFRAPAGGSLEPR